MVNLSVIGSFRHFLGLFNKTEFESRLIAEIFKSVDAEASKQIDDQLGRFNRVQRVLIDDPRLDCGSTMFYWIKNGKSMISEFPIRIRGLRDFSERVFFRCLVEDSEQNMIRVEFIAVHGVFVLLKYYSKKRVWYPKGDYVIRSTENLIPPI